MNSDFLGSQKPDFPLGVSVIQEDWPPLALGRTVAQARQPACSSISHTGMDLGWPNWSKTWPRGFCWEGGLFSSSLGPRRKSLALRAMWRLTLPTGCKKQSIQRTHVHLMFHFSCLSLLSWLVQPYTDFLVCLKPLKCYLKSVLTMLPTNTSAITASLSSGLVIL